MNELSAAIKFFVSTVFIYASVIIGGGFAGFGGAIMTQSDTAGVTAIWIVGGIGLILWIRACILLYHEVNTPDTRL